MAQTTTNTTAVQQPTNQSGQRAKDNFELSDSALMILGALKGNNPEDVLMMLPKQDVEQILANRTQIVSTLNKARLNEVESKGEVRIAEAKINRKVKLYENL